MEIISITTNHFVKSEDLNHHGTLFAGRTAEWFVEAGLMAAAVYLPPENIVCVKVHGMSFTHPVALGETIKFVSKVVYAGNTSITANTQVTVRDCDVINGFATFVCVDRDDCPIPHGLIIEATSEEDIALSNHASMLRHIEQEHGLL